MAEPRLFRSGQRLCWASPDAEPKPKGGCQRAQSHQPRASTHRGSAAFGKGLSWSCLWLLWVKAVVGAGEELARAAAGGMFYLAFQGA